MDIKANDMSQHWIVVVDAHGRERLEARWYDASVAVETAHAA